MNSNMPIDESSSVNQSEFGGLETPPATFLRQPQQRQSHRQATGRQRGTGASRRGEIEESIDSTLAPTTRSPEPSPRASSPGPASDGEEVDRVRAETDRNARLVQALSQVNLKNPSQGSGSELGQDALRKARAEVVGLKAAYRKIESEVAQLRQDLWELKYDIADKDEEIEMLRSKLGKSISVDDWDDDSRGLRLRAKTVIEMYQEEEIAKLKSKLKKMIGDEERRRQRTSTV
ncbi:hypothetical protein B0H66DRAFT_568333 [Apodospora peruviana]|uniref:Uncharacterized protein n=1 Tax=Apodospora peruviana TaxID=516989 RepID=A0AAE0HWY7_9PEZI|nr:hypothetical protein B0H66DRAFT_568333 [Apodospora peruviana]